MTGDSTRPSEQVSAVVDFLLVIVPRYFPAHQRVHYAWWRFTRTRIRPKGGRLVPYTEYIFGPVNVSYRRAPL